MSRSAVTIAPGRVRAQSAEQLSGMPRFTTESKRHGSTQLRFTPSGTWFSSLHATVQAWEPMHLRWSMTNP